MKDVFKQIIAEFQKESLPEVFTRNYSFSKAEEITVLVGLRRVGKTYLLYQEINKFPKDLCIYVNFEDERLEGLKPTDLQHLFEAYYELFPQNIHKHLYLFFDEVQGAPSWQKFLTRLYESKKYTIFVTGSSAKLLSKEIATELRGRVLPRFIFSLSFKEYLLFNNCKLDTLKMYSKERAILLNLFKDYMVFGGYPRVSQVKEHLQKRELLSTYLELIIYKDIVERYHIRNIELLKLLIKYLISNISKFYSLHSFYTSIKQNYSISKDSISDYFSYLLDSGLFMTLSCYSESVKKQNVSKSKIYVAEIGYKYSYGFSFSKDSGRVLENIVFLQLKRQSKEIYYHKAKHECDFVIKQGLKINEAIQVCYELNDENQKREITGLVEACKTHKLKKGLLLSYDHEESFQKDGVKIEVKPVWKWLLE